jgi:hypothetical protein
VTQLSLLAAAARDERPRKRVRQVSRAQYAELRDSDQLGTRAADVLRNLAAFYNRRADWPTAPELTQWMLEAGELPRLDFNLVRPRLTELCIGRHDAATGQLVGGGVIETLPRRQCRVTGRSAHPWRVREIGSAEAR